MGESERLFAAIDREVGALMRRAYDFSDAVEVSILTVSENAVYRVSDPKTGAAFVARVNSGRLGYHTKHQVESEMVWLTALHDETDIVVPKVKAAKDGSTVQVIEAPDLDRPRLVAVYSFLAGTEPPEDDLFDGFRRLGGISARMHQYAKTWVPPAAFHRPSWTPRVILDNGLNWGAWQDGVGVEGAVADLLGRTDRTVRARLEALATDRDRFGLIHADLRLANLLVDGDRTAIIDFDDLGYGWYLYDLAGALSFLEERPDAPDLIASWLDGYRAVEPVPEDVVAEVPSLIMLRRLQLVSWVGYQYHHIQFARDIGPQFTVETCRLAEAYLAMA